jgi:hypothetical protein
MPSILFIVRKQERGLAWRRQIILPASLQPMPKSLLPVGYTITSPACPGKLVVVTTSKFHVSLVIHIGILVSQKAITSTNLSIGNCSTIYYYLQIASLVLVNTTICKHGLLGVPYCLSGT